MNRVHKKLINESKRLIKFKRFGNRHVHNGNWLMMTGVLDNEISVYFDYFFDGNRCRYTVINVWKDKGQLLTIGGEKRKPLYRKFKQFIKVL